jgi:hypothetical protein
VIRDAEHAYDVGQEWLEDTIREEAPVCARCGLRSEWRDDDTGDLLCDGCAR